MTENTKLTPMLKQFLRIKEKHPDKLILFRMGDFYETFFEDAATASKVLGITLTARNKKADDPIPLAGFPYHALDNYLDKLVKNGLKVVICEQLEDPRQAKGLVKRDIVDIITPGSIIDGKLIDKTDNNYLAAVYCNKDKDKTGLALIDASTGDFLVTSIPSSSLEDELNRQHPSEIVTTSREFYQQLEKLTLNYQPVNTLYESWYYNQAEAEEFLLKHFGVTTLEGFGLHNMENSIVAAGIALHYIKSLKQVDLKHISRIVRYSLSDFLQLDETTRRNLELFKSIRSNQRQGSLISILDNTKTPMGSRKLSEWLLNPLLDQKAIEKRSAAVEELKTDFSLNAELRNELARIGDLSRIISKVGTRKVNPRDLIALKNYLATAPVISALLSSCKCILLQELHQGIADYHAIVDKLESSLTDNPPPNIMEGNIFREGYDQTLTELREISSNGKSWIARLEEYERKQTGISSLKVGYNKVFGYYLEVTSTHKDKVPEHYIRKQTLVNAERYISPQLKEYEAKVLGAEERIKNLEYELFCDLREELFLQVELMQRYVDVLARLDVLSNFAHLAYQKKYVRPVFNKDGILEIYKCRHPVIENLLESDEYIPNDVYLNDSDTRIVLITGPNMAGKSTYLRQIGLLIIMAQMGAFVPAEKAFLPVFDKIFTRVGASDNLAMGQSTFLVEMIEAANILNSATPASLVLLDEIGRGTSTFDGLSLAWAIVEYLHNRKELKPKTLFATHYHELTELENILPSVKNYNILVKEWNDKIIFLRKIERGCADQSYGIQVARLAGIPDEVIKRAKEILANLEEHELSPHGLSAKARQQLFEKSQLDIFDVIYEKAEAKNEILEEIKNTDIDNLTPLEAIKKLAELKSRL